MIPQPPGRPGGATYWRSDTVRRIGFEESYADPRVSPFLSHCARCRTAVAFVDTHSTSFLPERGDGCGILCEECWSELTPEVRLPFYRVWYEQSIWEIRTLHPDWSPWDPSWERIERAVLAGG